MDHQWIRSALAERADAVLAASVTGPLPFRPYQRETTDCYGSWLRDMHAPKRAHVIHATGLGKTVQFATWIRYMPDLRVLVVVPTKTLVIQTIRTLHAFTGKKIGYLSSLDRITDRDGEVIAERGLSGHSIVVTTAASFKRRVRAILERLDPHLIIVDEGHWGCTRKFQDALAAFREPVVMAFTATDAFAGLAARASYVPVTLDNGQTAYCHPDRMVRTHFGVELDRRSLRWGIEHAYLAPLAWRRIQTDLSLENVPLHEGEYGLEYDQGVLQRTMRGGWDLICEGVRRFYNDETLDLINRQTFSVCPGQVAADALAKTLWDDGCAAAYAYTGEVEDREAGILVDAFAERDIGHLASVFKLREGWDAPVAEVAFMLRAMQSILFYQQISGRVARPFADRKGKVGLVVDIAFRDDRFAPLSAPMVFAKPGEVIEEGGYLIPPPKKDSAPSPFLPPEHARSQVTVSVMEVERYADHEGRLQNEEGEWALGDTLIRQLHLDEASFTRLVVKGPIKIRKMVARRSTGRRDDFFSTRDVTESLKEMTLA